MKTKITLSILLSFVFYLLSSQVPQGFNYQAIARDASGNPITNATIGVKLSILTDTSGFYQNGTGTYIWEEEQTGIKTNAFGLFTIVFGDPSATKKQGSASSFSSIDWAKGPLYIGTKVANPTDYKNLGAAKLWSVPYSMVSDSTKALLKGARLSVISSNDEGTDALFEVKRKDGQTVFAVYPNAINIYVPRTTPKGVKGGFAIGGFDGSKTDPQDYFRVTPDSVRVYIDKTPTLSKGTTKGGFAIGGFDQSKGGGVQLQDLLTVNNDSIRMYIDKNQTPGKGTQKGGFAIGEFGVSKGLKKNYLLVTHDSTRILTADTLKGFGVSNLSLGNSQGYLRLTPSNYFIGHQSGSKITTGLYNATLGYRAGWSITTGSNNILLGYHTGSNITTGSANTLVGINSGTMLTVSSGNVFIGHDAGAITTSGDADIFIGNGAGQNVNTGSTNIFIGPYAGHDADGIDGDIAIGLSAGRHLKKGVNTLLGYQAGNTLADAEGNTFIGYEAGGHSNGGNYNVCVGVQAGGWTNCDLGSTNVFLGTYAGRKHGGDNNVMIGTASGGRCDTAELVGSGNVFIGNYSGYTETGSNKLYIDNTDTSSPLIYGDFSARQLGFNGKVGIGIKNPVYLISANGGAYCDGTNWTNACDRNLKENFETVDGKKILELLTNLPVTKWNYKSDKSKIKHIGPVSQDFFSLFGLGNDDISISSIDPSGIALVAIKQLIMENERLNTQLESLQERLKRIELLLGTNDLK